MQCGSEAVGQWGNLAIRAVTAVGSKLQWQGSAAVRSVRKMSNYQLAIIN